MARRHYLRIATVTAAIVAATAASASPAIAAQTHGSHVSVATAPKVSAQSPGPAAYPGEGVAPHITQPNTPGRQPIPYRRAPWLNGGPAMIGEYGYQSYGNPLGSYQACQVMGNSMIARGTYHGFYCEAVYPDAYQLYVD